MSPLHFNLLRPKTSGVLRDSDRIVASPDGNHFFTFRPDWAGPAPLPFQAAAATIDLVSTVSTPSVLILGFGMGAVGAMMKRRRPESTITGIETDRKLYKAAKETLDEGTVLHRSDAVSFLRRCDDRFDLILDDCFVVINDDAGDSQPYRPAKLEVVPELVKQRLVEGGIYARNLLDQDDLSLDLQRSRILEHFVHAYDREFEDWDNVLTVASDRELDGTRVALLGEEAGNGDPSPELERSTDGEQTSPAESGPQED